MLPSLKATPSSNFDLPVEPVGGIGEKFKAVIRAFRGRNDPPPAPTVFLVPEHLPTGELVTEVYRAKLAELRSELGIAVRPVATLGDAMRAVGAGHPSMTLADRAALAALGVVAASVVLAGAAWWVLAIPVDVRFVPVPFPGINQSTPIREAADGSFGVPCLLNHGLPGFHNATSSPDPPYEISEPKQPHSGRLRLQRHDTDQFQPTMRMSFVTVTTPSPQP